ncbi:thiolase family protein [Bosea sp. (in: a-proteobacteria)]|uniref:thiolase family protein n=1 Tax=Bosea sp. (in: a-proteobacteria) TaxID=1871050 RepID=UPI00262B6256|nr:thiolase family protein [Bosea sp. (in: a-proteobacteria)]MCO5089596.1 thiolase family protein [Bosea sp. (in: a-proteobacteria)]
MSLTSNRKDSVAVVGVGMTDFGKLPDHDATSLGIWALRNAAEDAGLTLKDIDGIAFHRLSDYQKFIQITSMSPRLLTVNPGAGRMLGGTLQIAVQAILSGMLDTVAVVYGNDGRTAGARYGGKEDRYGTSAEQLWFPYGMTSPGAIHAMAFQRHAALYGTTIEQLATISRTFRDHALLNPGAVMRKPISMQDYLDAPFICEPLRRLDYCLINDGGVAMILTSGERARDMRRKPVYLRGMAQLSRLAQGELPEDFGYATMQQVSGRVHEMAGVSREDVAALMIYDNFTPTVLFTLEGFGYCPRGEGGRFVEDGVLSLKGRYPTNTNGGHLSESYMQGWSLNVEAVRQVRGELGTRQVPEAGIVQYLQGGPLSTSVIYGREPS